MDKPYNYSSTSPNLRLSFVCYADILGYTQLGKEAINSGKGEQFLSHLRNTLTTAYDRVRVFAEGLDNKEYYSIKVFTDNIVVGYPLSRDKSYGDVELWNILSIFAEFQASLAMEGFLIRGGIAFGEHYMDDEIVLGDALIDAIHQDKHGGPPCISLSPSAVEMLKLYFNLYGETRWVTQYQDLLLSDSDGTFFLNYLHYAFIAYPDGGSFFDLIEGHKKTIIEGLEKYREVLGVKTKYEWAARYHNFVCNEFVERHPGSSNPDAAEDVATAAFEAQQLSDYLIDIEAFAVMPSRIDLKQLSSNK